MRKGSFLLILIFTFGVITTGCRKEEYNNINKLSSRLEVDNLSNTVKVSLLAASETSTQALNNNLLIKAALEAIPNGGKIEIVYGTYTFTDSITLNSNTIIEGNESEFVFNFNDLNPHTAIYIPAGSSRIEINNLQISCGSYSILPPYTAIKMDGLRSNLIKEITLNKIKVSSFKSGLIAKNVRLSTFDECAFAVKEGIVLNEKCGDINVTNSNLIYCEQFGSNNYENSFGLRCIQQYYYDSNDTLLPAESQDGYPEGLNVTNTLFYKFDRNIIINELFIGKFDACKFDQFTVDGTVFNPNPLVIDKRFMCGKNEGVSFSNCWFCGKGFAFGGTLSGGHNNYRCMISNSLFNAQQTLITIQVNHFVDNVSIADCNFNQIDDGASSHIGILCYGDNYKCSFNSLNFDGYGSFGCYIDMRGYGENNSITNIPNISKLKYPISISSQQVYMFVANVQAGI